MYIKKINVYFKNLVKIYDAIIASLKLQFETS